MKVSIHPSWTNPVYERLDWVHFAIQEALNGNPDELEKALEIVEDLRNGSEYGFPAYIELLNRMVE